MNLLDSLCRLHLPDYTFRRFVIYHIPAYRLVELAEMYFTRVGQGYAKNGGGLSHTGAGASTASADNYDDEDYGVFWEYAKTTVIEENVKDWKAMIARKVKGNDEETAALNQEAYEKESAYKQYLDARRQYEEWLKPLPEEEEAEAWVDELHRVNDEVKKILDSHLTEMKKLEDGE